MVIVGSLRFEVQSLEVVETKVVPERWVQGVDEEGLLDITLRIRAESRGHPHPQFGQRVNSLPHDLIRLGARVVVI